MNTKSLLASAAFSAALLASGVGYAADGFQAQLREAEIAAADAGSATVERSDRDTAVVNLSVARSLYGQGHESEAYRYLNFARGELGLPAQAIVASPVLATPGTAAGHESFEQQLAEAKARTASTARENRETINPDLTMAESLAAQGRTAAAQPYLDYVRGKVGLDVYADHVADNGGIVGLRPEVR